MSSFGDKVVHKLGKHIPDHDKQSFKKLSVRCLREGVPSGLNRLKTEINNLDENPSEDVLREIEDLFTEYSNNTQLFEYSNDQAASIAAILTKIADKIYLDEGLTPEQKSSVMDETRTILGKLQSVDILSEETVAEIIQHLENTKTVVGNLETMKDAISDLVETVKELVLTNTE